EEPGGKGSHGFAAYASKASRACVPSPSGERGRPPKENSLLRRRARRRRQGSGPRRSPKSFPLHDLRLLRRMGVIRVKILGATGRGQRGDKRRDKRGRGRSPEGRDPRN